jgi:dolichol kinase
MTKGIFNELGRKTIHITILLVLIAYYFIKQTYGKQIALLCLVALLVLFFILEYFRLELDFKLPFFDKFIRPKERFKVYGVIYFLSGTIIALAVFDFNIALAAILMTTFGDMAAALIGKRFGKTLLYRNKTIHGCVSELIVNLIVGFVALFGFNIYIGITMAFTATIVETLADELDDNILVPLFAGFVGQMLFLLL